MEQAGSGRTHPIPAAAALRATPGPEMGATPLAGSPLSTC
jgi:hypothetical protein